MLTESNIENKFKKMNTISMETDVVVEDKQKELSLDCYCRKTTLKSITQDHDIVSTLEQLVVNTSHIIRDTYNFVRLYMIHLLSNNEKLPIINKEFMRAVFTLVSNRKRIKGTKADIIYGQLEQFYDEEYKPFQRIKVDAVPKDILEYESTTIITSIENHIKVSLFSYVKKLAFVLTYDDPLQYKKVLTDLLNKDLLSKKKVKKNKTSDRTKTNKKQGECDVFKSNEQYHTVIRHFNPLITNAIKETISVSGKPQLCFPLMYTIASMVEEKRLENDINAKARKLRSCAIIPLRRSLVPKYIRLDNSIFTRVFRVMMKEKKLDIWENIKNEVAKTMKSKEGFMLSSFQTDGVACSLVFKKGNRYVEGTKRPKARFSEKYFEDLGLYDEFKGKRIVAIDPNKGNLVYCFDGKTTLRYTQNERRKASKKTIHKYRRKNKENTIGEGIIKNRLDDLSGFNSRSCSYVGFKDYVGTKNLYNRDFCSLYQDTMFRKNNWHSWINLRRSEDKFANRFKDTYVDKISVDGRDVYDMKNTVVVFGDWEERPSFLRGKEPTKGKGMRSLLRKAGLTVYLLDEFRTSKTCHICNSENESNVISREDPRPWKKGESQLVWGLLRCTNGDCRRIHNRDFNSASNILEISRTIICSGNRPNIFDRSLCCND